MNSHNHPMMGSIGSWLYRALGGLRVDPAGPGFARFFIEPCFVDELNNVSTELETVKGNVLSKWVRQQEAWDLTVRIPVGSVAQIRLRSQDITAIYCGGVNLLSNLHPAPVIGIDEVTVEAGMIILTTLSGTYSFQIEIQKGLEKVPPSGM